MAAQQPFCVLFLHIDQQPNSFVKGSHCLCNDFAKYQYSANNGLHSNSVVVFGVNSWWQLLQWCINGWQLLPKPITIHTTSRVKSVWSPRLSSHCYVDFCDTNGIGVGCDFSIRQISTVWKIVFDPMKSIYISVA